jgi:hypothetical protein
MPKRHLSSNSKRSRGRPRTHQEDWSKINVVLFDRQVWFLDQMSVSIRRRSGAAVNRTQIVRALIDALKNSRVDVSAVQSEADLIGALTRQLTRHPH